MRQTSLGAAALVLFTVLGMLAASCDSPAGSSDSSQTRISVRALPAEFLSRKAIAYSGYRGATHDDAGTPSIANINEDLGLLKAQGFGLLRVFGSNNKMVKDLLSEIKNNASYDFKVQLGIWISGPKASFDAANQAEIAAGVTLANQYPDIVQAVSVGNENMVSWNSWAPAPADDIVAYIALTRGQIAQPVTTDDNWAVFANLDGAYPKTDKVLANVDFVSIHTYALADSIHSSGAATDPAEWDWKQVGVADPNLRAAAMMDAALAKTKKDYAAVKTYMGKRGFGSLPITIGETGWQSAPANGAPDRAHPVNQKMYLDRLASWTDGPKQIFYFEAFDETWKGSDDMWGLWDVSRQPKYAISGTGYTAADAVHYVPIVPNGTITKNKYWAYADTIAADATTAIPVGTTSWIGWNVPWTVSPAEITASGGDTAAEGAKYLQITPTPAVWGWGIFVNNTSPDDLTNFKAAGHLNFSLRTTYAGKLEVGFFTKGTAAIPGDSDVYLPIASGSYGFVNDGNWHTVSIPLATIAAKQAPAYNQPGTAALNMQLVANPFVIADRYANTANSLTAGQKILKVDVDNIYWTQD